MSRVIFANNLPASIGLEYLYIIFGIYGTVSSIKIISDEATGSYTGMALIEMPCLKEARIAANKLNLIVSYRSSFFTVLRENSSPDNKDMFDITMINHLFH